MIQWNKVTWYSILCAVVLFIGLPIVAFYLGIQYGRAESQVENLEKIQAFEEGFLRRLQHSVSAGSTVR